MREVFAAARTGAPRELRGLPGPRHPDGHDAERCRSDGRGAAAGGRQRVLPAAADLRAHRGPGDHEPGQDHNPAEQGGPDPEHGGRHLALRADQELHCQDQGLQVTHHTHLRTAQTQYQLRAQVYMRTAHTCEGLHLLAQAHCDQELRCEQAGAGDRETHGGSGGGKHFEGGA